MIPLTVVGVDLSLTSTGLAVVTDGVLTDVWTEGSKGKKADTWEQRAERLRDLAQRVVVGVNYHQPQLVVIESPSYGSVHGSQHDRSGLWWMVVSKLRALDFAVACVAPQGRAKYGAGKGNAPKDAVLAAVAVRYGTGGVSITGNDIADAVILASMGSRYLGHPVESSLPATHLAAMDGVHWPWLVTDLSVAA